MPVASFVATGTACAAIRSLLAREGPAFPEERRSCSPSPQAPHPFPSALFRENETMRGRRAFPASTVPRKPQQQKMRICSIAKGPLKERAFLLAYEMASGNLKHCARVGRDQGGSIKGANVFSFNPRARQTSNNTMFQSTRPRGARRRRKVRPRAAVQFQSTRPRGARRYQWRAQTLPSYCFNPRARVGRDASKNSAISRPVCFNPRARVGRDSAPCGRDCLFSCFNPRARVGRDAHGRAHAVSAHQFQSTRPRGARRLKMPACNAGTRSFNPRARAGRDGAAQHPRSA